MVYSPVNGHPSEYKMCPALINFIDAAYDVASQLSHGGLYVINQLSQAKHGT